MMLLTAFVLVIAFVALTAMVARVSQLPEETRQSADRPIYIEAEALGRGVESALEDLNVVVGPREDGSDMDLYMDAVADAMEHLETLESARGYRLKLDAGANPSCDDSSGSAVVTVAFSLADARTTLHLTISWTVVDIYTQTPNVDETDPMNTTPDNKLQNGYIDDAAAVEPDNAVQSCAYASIFPLPP